MTAGVSLWNTFVGSARRDADALDDGVGRLSPDEPAAGDARLAELAYLAFRIGGQSLLLGAEDVGRLALACERCLDLLAAGALLAGYALPVLASSTWTLRQAFEHLASPDSSGARTERVPLEAARYELETLFPAPGAPRADSPLAPDVPVTSLTRGRAAPAAPADATAASAPAPPAATGTPDATAAPAATGTPDAPTWTPTIDDDMVELFFEEADERLEDLLVKLVDIERRPDDAELLRGVFRDLHTVKGSSAMVGLAPLEQLAHAAEDLVGQIREGDRALDRPVVDALLGALDGLREILALARDRRPLAVELAPLVRRLRDPSSSPQPAAAPEPSASVAETDASLRASQAERQTIRVDFDKLDRLMNLVGELVLGRDGLHGAVAALASVGEALTADAALGGRRARGPRRERADDDRALGEELDRVERVLSEITQDLSHSTGRLDSVSSELREQVMTLRLVPVGGVFRKHHRTVRDLANALGKRVRLELDGEDTELDKLLVEALDEPLMHLVRNAVDHGVEPPEERVAAGKPAEGSVALSARHRGNQVIIQLRDDGRGLDPARLRQRAAERGLCGADEAAALDDAAALELIFRPGFSTAAQVTEVSGRGVGMDVVKQTIVSRLKGTIDIDSTPGAGTTFTLRLPLTLAIMQVLLARTGGEVLAIPLDAVVRTITRRGDEVGLIGEREVIPVRRRQVPLIRLSEVLELDPDPHGADEPLHVILTDVGGERYGLACEHLLGKKEIVIKPLGALLENVPCAAGATLLGDRCALIVDVPAVIRRALRRGPGSVRRRSAVTRAGAAEGAPRVLLVEDSETVRESLRRLLSEAGYDCTVATDGVEGLALARTQRFDLVSTDVMMPRMDGYELTRALRATAEYRDTPIVMVTSRGERIDRARGFDAGVDEYITKPHDRQLLLRAVRKLLAEREDLS